MYAYIHSALVSIIIIMVALIKCLISKGKYITYNYTEFYKKITLQQSVKIYPHTHMLKCPCSEMNTGLLFHECMDKETYIFIYIVIDTCTVYKIVYIVYMRKALQFDGIA